jgi:hypothetical protein
VFSQEIIDEEELSLTFRLSESKKRHTRCERDNAKCVIHHPSAAGDMDSVRLDSSRHISSRGSSLQSYRRLDSKITLALAPCLILICAQRRSERERQENSFHAFSKQKPPAIMEMRARGLFATT